MPKVRNERYHVGSGAYALNITFPFVLKKGAQRGTFFCCVTCSKWVTADNREGRLRKSTTIKLSMAHWDKKKSEISRGYEDREIVKEQLVAIVDRIRVAYASFSRRKGNPAVVSSEDVARIIDGRGTFATRGPTSLLTVAKATKGITYGGLVGHFLSHYVSSDGRKLIEMHRHYKNFQTMASNLNLFMMRYYPRGLTLECLEKEFVDFAKNWFRYHVHERQAAVNSTANVTKRLRHVISWAVEENYMSHVSLKPLAFTAKQHPKVALSEDDVRTLIAYEFGPGQERIERVRDMFALLCLSGLRFEDLWKLDKAREVEDYAHVPTDKDGGLVVVPLFPETRKLLLKYPAGLNRISNQKFNAFVKEACEIVGLTQLVTVKVQRGQRLMVHKRRLCDIVSAHSGRRSFVTICRTRGIPDQIIMRVTGHKSTRMLDAYTLIPELEVMTAFGRKVERRDEGSSLFSLA